MLFRTTHDLSVKFNFFSLLSNLNFDLRTNLPREDFEEGSFSGLEGGWLVGLGVFKGLLGVFAALGVDFYGSLLDEAAGFFFAGEEVGGGHQVEEGVLFFVG